MRTLKRNKQKMYYAVPLSSSPIYERDDNGNIIYYVDDDGESQPLETGEYKDGFSEPRQFYGNISGQLKQTLLSEFGVINSPNYAKLLVDKGEFNFVVGTLIWKNTEPQYDEDNEVEQGSADYSILGVIDEFINEDTYFLHKKVK